MHTWKPFLTILFGVYLNQVLSTYFDIKRGVWFSSAHFCKKGKHVSKVELYITYILDNKYLHHTFIFFHIHIRFNAMFLVCPLRFQWKGSFFNHTTRSTMANVTAPWQYSIVPMSSLYTQAQQQSTPRIYKAWIVCWMFKTIEIIAFGLEMSSPKQNQNQQIILTISTIHFTVQLDNK
jgi:hypothetical protein